MDVVQHQGEILDMNFERAMFLIGLGWISFTAFMLFYVASH